MSSLKRIGFLFIVCFALINVSAANRTASISVDNRTSYQHVTGFGGFSPSPQWSYWLSNSDIDKLFGKGDNQLGYTIMRLYIASNKNGWGSAIANAKQAKKYGVFVFASPWSPQASWKDNNDESNGGALLTSHYRDWALYLNDFVTYMKNNGVALDAISVQNEPDWKASYQSCIWTGSQMASFLKDYGSLINTKIIAPEGIQFTHSLSDPILNDPDACAELDILGGHFYGWNGSSYPLAMEKNKEVWMTEYLINDRQENKSIDIDWNTDGFLFARSINDAMLANMSAWVHYSLKRYYGCIGDGKFGTVDGQITKRGYVLSHYAKYVSGTTRIKHSLNESEGVMTSSAYETVTGDSVVVMLLNPSSATYDFTFELPFLSEQGMSVVTNSSVNMKKTALTFDTETYQPTSTIDPYSVSTFIFKKSGDRTDMGDQETKGDVIFSSGFDTFGADCVPSGWRTVFENGTRDAGNYSSGPRLFSFSPEGEFSSGFYFRGNSSVLGSVSYGKVSNYHLTLSPGDYKLTYLAKGWKANGAVTCEIQTFAGKQITKSTLTVSSHQSGSKGSSVRIVNSDKGELDFSVDTQGDYVINWSLPQSLNVAQSGLYEMIISDVIITKLTPTGIDTPSDSDKKISERHYYDMKGNEIINPLSTGFYIEKIVFEDKSQSVSKITNN